MNAQAKNLQILYGAYPCGTLRERGLFPQNHSSQS
jgi:hypothetical protein